MRAEWRVAWLCRTLTEARVAWDGHSTGDGVTLLPSLYREGSYAELEARLSELRDADATRAIWWHCSMRFRYGTVKRLVVPLRQVKGLRDAKPILPECSRLVADGEREGRKRAQVVAYVWDERVDQRAADAGLEALASLMYGGDRGKIVLPVSVLHEVAGRLP